jgi:MFS family permease
MLRVNEGYSEISAMTPAAPKLDDPPTPYAWFCLIVILFISIGNQWQRYTIAYAYGVGKDKAYADDDGTYAIQKSYPELTPSVYGLLSGLAFTLSFSICGIFAGYFSDKTNRRVLMGAACVLWSICTLLTGLINSFPVLFVLRFGLGIFESAFNPCAYSIISDLFAPSYRTTANSVFNLGIYFGGALASLSTLMIT